MEKAGTSITKIVRMHGYEYILVYIERDEIQNLENPCFMGYKGYALHAIRKIKETKILKRTK